MWVYCGKKMRIQKWGKKRKKKRNRQKSFTMTVSVSRLEIKKRCNIWQSYNKENWPSKYGDRRVRRVNITNVRIQ